MSVLSTEPDASKSVKALIDRLDPSFFEGCNSLDSRRKRVQMDLKFLKDIGYVLENTRTVEDPGEASARSKPCYYIDKAAFPLAMPPMEDTDALKVVLAMKYLRYVLPVSVGPQLSTIDERAQLKVSELESAKKQSWLHKVAIVPPLLAIKYHDINEKHLSVLHQALLEQKKCEIDYVQPLESSSTKYIIDPFALVLRDTKLVCIARNKGVVKQFLCNRIKDIAPIYQPFAYPGDFHLDDFVKSGAVNFIYSEQSQVTEINLEVCSHVKVMLIEGKLFDDQVITPIDDTWSSVTFTCPLTRDLDAWLMAHSKFIRIKSPTSLRNRIVAELKEGLLNNS